MHKLFGLETEYGIQISGVAHPDVVVESMELVRCYLHRDFRPLWDYGLEDPHQDARGFAVDELLNDSDETTHLQKDRQRKIPLQELKSDLILPNGARFYNDHTHPEYATPECANLRDLLASDRAGERILLECARRRGATRGDGGAVRLYKNNTDFDGHSYGCHENYLLTRDIPFQKVIEGLVPFLVTRQVFAGAGKVGVEADHRANQAVFQLAQRSDFFDVVASVDTMTRRPIVNTRDEPHADPARYRRLHVIIGDANMSEFATALKVGTLSLVLELLELLGQGDPLHPGLADPIGALKSISRDPTRTWAVELEDGTHTTALEIQHVYLARARQSLSGRDAETDRVLAQWGEVVEALGGDPATLVGRCDWVTKKWMIDAFVAAEGLDWQRPEDRAWLQSQDLEYHNIDPDEGLFLLMESADPSVVSRTTTEEEVRLATVTAPRGTRARFRGRCMERFGDSVRAANWDRIEFCLNGTLRVVDLRGCVEADRAATFNAVLDRADTVEALIRGLEEVENA